MRLQQTELPYIDSAALFDSVADQDWAMMLDSGTINGKASSKRSWGYDLLAVKPHVTLVFDGDTTHVRQAGQSEYRQGDPLTILQQFIPTTDLDPDFDVPYLPGAIGYFAYDLARAFEQLPSLAADDEQLPPMAVGIFHVVLLVDHGRKKSVLMQLGDSVEDTATATEWRRLVEHQHGKSVKSDMANEQDGQTSLAGLQGGPLNVEFDREGYRRAFDKVRQYTIDGDCYQVNLTQRFSVPVTGSAWATYRYLRALSPAPYGAYFNFPFAQVLSNSPESFIECRDRKVTTSPIKGTRPRALQDADKDREIALALQASPKDRAENVMIVDLMRNDLSRCCELGSVTVPSLFDLHSFANVHHLISTVTGTLKPELHALDLLRHCFPGGSITGAPKIRAMQIIEELEPQRRGLYCGAIGYVGVDGSLSTNIAIRTIVVKDGIARYSAGGGLVIDSVEEDEYQELLDKASMMTNALFDRR